LVSGPGAGALTLVWLFILDLLSSPVGFLGFRDRRAIETVMERARSTAIEQQLIILLTLAVAGALMGTVGTLIGRAWRWARARPPAEYGVLSGIFAALVGHGFLLARSVIQYPQLYSAHLYERGGVRQAVMVFLTDHVPLWALDAGLALLLCVAFLVPALSCQGRALARSWVGRAPAVARRHPRSLAVVVSVIAILGLLITLGRGHRRPAPPRRERPNVLIIAVDSLRPDRVYGPDAATRFPTLAGLARRGVRFREAYVTQARTFPAFVSLLTGRYPHHHGIRHEFPPAKARRAIGATLPSVLAAAGWRTAVVADYAGDIFPRTPLGFQIVDAPHFDLYVIVKHQILTSHLSILPYATTGIGQRIFPSVRSMAEFADPALLADRAGSHLDRLADRPFFMTVFFSASHSPYAAPAPYYGRYSDPRYRGIFRYLKQPLPQQAVLPPADARQVRALYDGALAAIDAAVARLLHRLERSGQAQNTIVVLLGDHGENLFEVPGRGMGHGDHLWGGLANHIPLVIVDPTRQIAPRDVRGIVRDVDLAPTLGRLLGVPAPPGDGVDLGPLLTGKKDTLNLDAYAETGLWLLTSGPGYRRPDRLPYPDIWNVTEAAANGDIFVQPKWEQTVVTAKVRSIRTPRWKLVYQPAPEGAYWRLFDVIGDPDERRDVAADHPAEVMVLRAKLQAWITADGRTQVVPDAR